MNFILILCLGILVFACAVCFIRLVKIFTLPPIQENQIDEIELMVIEGEIALLKEDIEKEKQKLVSAKVTIPPPPFAKPFLSKSKKWVWLGNGFGEWEK